MEGNLALQEERREELIGGRLVIMAPASSSYTYIADNNLMIFKHSLKGKPCIPFGNGLLVHLTDEYAFVPDVMVVCDRSKIRSDGVYGAPDLVVEVLSPSTAKNDRGRKEDIYEQCGVREYWIVNPTDKVIEQYLLQNGKFVLHDTYVVFPNWMLARMTPEERGAVVTEFKCSLYHDLIIQLDDFFEDWYSAQKPPRRWRGSEAKGEWKGHALATPSSVSV